MNDIAVIIYGLGSAVISGVFVFLFTQYYYKKNQNTKVTEGSS